MPQSKAISKEYTIEELNAIFTPLSFKERLVKLYDYFGEKDILYTSSFGTKSVFLLHLINQLEPEQKVYFLNTQYHFPATLDYKKELTNLFKLRLEEIVPNAAQNKMTTEEKWWIEHPRMCCTINKIAPLDAVVTEHKIWLSGLMSYQTDFRSRLHVFEQQGDIIKFHPLIDIDEGEFLYHMDFYKLPKHPLESSGYGSIGCSHCTKPGQGRSGRWIGSGKTECGLHPSYFKKKSS